MKKKILLAAIVVICLSVVATGTLAYFTAEGTARNVITSGFVDIELIEKHIGEDGTEVDFPGEITGVMPGCSVSKIVSVKNTGAESWIRVSVEKVVTAPDGSALPGDLITFQVDESKWLLKDGFYYYRLPVAPGESTDILFDEVHFDGAMGNEYQGCKTEILVYAQAVQTANNGATVEEALGWPEPEMIE